MKPTLKLFTLFILAQLLTLTLSAQITTNSQWTWMKGDSTVNQKGVYGTQGFYAASNKPGSRDRSVSWKDTSGNLWLFGGIGYDKNGNFGELNDLWNYNFTINQWKWVKGDSGINKNGIYGIQGTATLSNKPGGRDGSFSWVDAAGNCWLFGGSGFDAIGYGDLLNDLWKYAPLTNQWTWISGDTTIDHVGIYGSLGITTATSKPGSRTNGVSCIDLNGNFWIFGGKGYDAETEKNLNDLWKYNLVTNQWTWVKGDSIGNGNGIYGTKSISNPTNKPGARVFSVSWTDLTGKLWIFGGYGFDANTGHNFVLNDLWKYDPASNQWTWINGDSFSGSPAIYGVKGIAGSANTPGGREGASSVADSNGDLWLFGGLGLGTHSGISEYLLNDLWKYNISANNWTWVKGDSTIDQNGIYGTQGATSNANNPGSREWDNLFYDNNSNFWIFGGYGYAASGSIGLLNDLWGLSKMSFIWIGITSTDWTVASNWSGGVVPGPNDDATIPGSTPFSAMVPNGVTVSCRSVTITTGAVVTLGTNAHLNVMH